MSSDVKFSIIVPTCGRPSLYATLVSIIRAGALEIDQVIVAADGPQPEAVRIVSTLSGRLPVRYIETAQTKNSGNHQRNEAMDFATGTHLLFLDDDDTYVDLALAKIRTHVAQVFERVYLFKMKGLAKRLFYDVLWTEKVLRMGNVGTPMACVPNITSLPRWGKDYWADFGFIQGAVSAIGREPVWVDEVIAEIR